jgi:hypothetical protein
MKSVNCEIVHDGPECDTWVWKAGHQIEIALPVVAQLGVLEIHVKPDGAVDDQPSLCLVMEAPSGLYVLTQISLESIWPAIEAAIKSKRDLV